MNSFSNINQSHYTNFFAILKELWIENKNENLCFLSITAILHSKSSQNQLIFHLQNGF